MNLWIIGYILSGLIVTQFITICRDTVYNVHLRFTSATSRLVVVHINVSVWAYVCVCVQCTECICVHYKYEYVWAKLYSSIRLCMHCIYVHICRHNIYIFIFSVVSLFLDFFFFNSMRLHTYYICLRRPFFQLNKLQYTVIISIRLLFTFVLFFRIVYGFFFRKRNFHAFFFSCCLNNYAFSLAFSRV